MSALFGEYIRASREALKKRDSSYSLRQLAARIDVKPSYLSRIERGEAFALSEEKTLALARELAVNPDVLLALSGKISSDVQEVIRKRPELFAEIIREFKGLPDSAVRADKEYRLMESRLKEAQRIARIGSWEIDLASGRIYRSDEFFRIFETERDDSRLNPEYLIENLVVPEDRERLRRDYYEGFPRRGATDIFCRFRTFAGNLRHGQIQGLVDYGEDGKPVRYRGTFQDVTEQREAEEALRHSEERYRALLEDQTEVISRTKADGTILFVNEACCRFFGKTREELMGRKWQPMAVPEELPRIETQLAELSPENPVALVENRVVAGSGEMRWMQFVNRGFFDASGKLREIQTVGRDITDRKAVEAKLKQSEQQYRLLAENVGDVLTLFDKDLRDVFVSPSVKRLLGYEPEEFLRLPQKRFLTPDSVALMRASISRLRNIWNQGEQIKSSYKMELVFIHRDGRMIPTEVSSSPLFENGVFSGMLNVIRDISDRKAAEQRHRVTDIKLAGILDHSPSIIQIKDLKGRYLLVNRKYEESFGVAAERLLGKNPHDFLPPELAGQMLADDGQVIESGRPITREEAIQTVNGMRTFLTTKFPVMDDQGNIYAVCGICTDISERKDSERKLSESERYLRMILDAVEDMILVYEPDGSIVDVNRAAERILGYTRDEFLALNKREILSPSYRDGFEPRITVLLRKRRQYFQSEYVRGSGEVIPVEVKAGLMQYAGRNLILSAARDVAARCDFKKTDQKESRDKSLDKVMVTDAAGRVQYEHPQAKAAGTAAAALQGASFEDGVSARGQVGKNEVLALLTEEIANELNNSLLPIILNVEMVRNRLREDPVLQRRLSDALDSAGRARDVVRQLLEINGRGAGDSRIACAGCVVEDALLHIRALKPKNIRATKRIASDCPNISVDSKNMRRLLLNVCDNAARAMGPQGGLMEISLQGEHFETLGDVPHMEMSPGRYAVLRVASRAGGEAPDKDSQDIAGSPSVREKVRDFDFDLSVARMIAVLNGGALDARSDDGSGACITIYLPAVMGFEGDGAQGAADGVSAGIAETYREE